MIPVTKPFLPPRKSYEVYLDEVWDRNWLTNNGPLVNKLEMELKDRLGLQHLLYVSNGTIALQLAIKALELEGEIVTTPFSYVATTSSIVWEGCRPVFVDIDRRTLNLDPSKIEDALTKDTVAILATHVFGNPCDVEAIEAIAERHGLKVIYDAAHAFGVEHNGRSLFSYGDVSATSFHATKLFHTIEGGAVFARDAQVLRKMALLRNFGHTSATSFAGVGINGKNSEFHAAMGLSNLPHIDEVLARRKQQYCLYREMLDDVEALTFQHLVDEDHYNYAYMPVLFETESVLMQVIDQLDRNHVQARRYFYPSLSSLDYVDAGPTPECDFVADKVLCLPLFHDLRDSEIEMIARLIKRVVRYG